jgi:uncharacterized protein (TIGR04222 family)
VAVQFEPPKGVPPGMVGTIIDETADPIDVSASVIDLAVRGYLRIEEIERRSRDWRLTRLVQADDELMSYERSLLDGLFVDGDSVILSELKQTFGSTLDWVQRRMNDEVVNRGWFRTSPQRERTKWRSLGIIVAVSGVVVVGLLTLLDVFQGAYVGALVLGAGLLLAGGVIWLLGSRMPARTATGSAVLAQSLGFKEYLTTAEAGQIAFEDAARIFSRYLPYAVVFGVAQRWAGTFAEVARAAQVSGERLVMPDWYLGSGGVVPGFEGIASGVESFDTRSAETFRSGVPSSTPGSSGASGFDSGGSSDSGGGGSSSDSW